MFPSFVSAASQPRVAAPSVDFHPHHEVVLLSSATKRGEASELAESLLALGFDALVLSGSLDDLVGGLPAGAPEDGPALLVPCDAEVDTPVLRSRVRRSFHREHLWLERSAGATALELQREICARLDELERERTLEVPIDPVDVDEVSNVVLLPVAPPRGQSASNGAASKQAAQKPAKYHYVLWPMVGAALTALGMAAVRPSEAPSTRAAEADVVRVVPPAVKHREANEPAPPSAAPLPAPTPEPPARAAAAAAPVVQPEVSPEQEALTDDRVRATEDYLVFEASEKPRDWYAAMDLCRGRAHAGLEGWTTPSSRQLHALAKARVLPEQPLWSRTRSMREADAAFVVHGRAGTLHNSNKSDSVPAAVCVRKRTER